MTPDFLEVQDLQVEVERLQDWNRSAGYWMLESLWCNVPYNITSCLISGEACSHLSTCAWVKGWNKMWVNSLSMTKEVDAHRRQLTKYLLKEMYVRRGRENREGRPPCIRQGSSQDGSISMKTEGKGEQEDKKFPTLSLGLNSASATTLSQP